MTRRHCFLIMPFSAVPGIASAREWTRTFDELIKPAVESAGLGYACVRSAPLRGNLIRSIMDDIWKADALIADLTGQKANVFYELGVRHALRGRSLLIARRKRDIPSDLQSYAWHIYDDKSKLGRDRFFNVVRDFLEDVETNPHRHDNPVEDFLQSEHQEAFLHRLLPQLATQVQNDAVRQAVADLADTYRRISIGQIPISGGKVGYFSHFFDLLEPNTKPEQVKVFASVSAFEVRRYFSRFGPSQLFPKLQQAVEAKKLKIEYTFLLTSESVFDDADVHAFVQQYLPFASEVRVVFQDTMQVKTEETERTIALMPDRRWAMTHGWGVDGEIIDPTMWILEKDYKRLAAPYNRIRLDSRPYEPPKSTND